jgi:hypothetical protein
VWRPAVMLMRSAPSSGELARPHTPGTARVQRPMLQSVWMARLPQRSGVAGRHSAQSSGDLAQPHRPLRWTHQLQHASG